MPWEFCFFLCHLNGTKTDRLYPSAPLENIDLEQKLERKKIDVSSFNNSINNVKEVVSYFKDRQRKPKKKHKKFEMLTRILKSFDTFYIIVTTSNSYRNGFDSYTNINWNSIWIKN